MKGRDLDELVAEWHESDDPRPLHEALGMTWEQYAEWVRGRDADCAREAIVRGEP